VNLCLDGKLAVVVGAGEIGARKAEVLVEAGARVRAVGKRFSTRFDGLRGVEKVCASYAKKQIAGAAVVIAATNDEKLNAAIARDARAGGAIVNVVDTPDLCDFIFPAVVRKGDIAVAISTGGASPTLAKHLKKTISSLVDDVYAGLARVLAEIRPEVLKKIRDARRRKEFFEAMVDDRFIRVVREKGPEAALEKARALLRKKTVRKRAR
jgi:siroheme synthase-like protein